MGVAYTGARGEPVVASTGNPPTFASDLTAISEFFAKASYRRFTNLTTLLAADGVSLGDLAKADDASGRPYEWNGTDWVPWLVPFRPADLDALNNIVGATSGDLAVVVEGGALFRRTASAWVQVTPATFASTGARDTAYAKASAAYRVAGAEAFVTGTGSPLWRHNGTAWVLWSQTLTAWTPTVTAVALGSTGSASGRYRVVQGWCEYWGKLQFLGTSPSISASPRHSLPLTPSTTWDDDVWMVEQGIFRDASVSLTDLSSMKPMLNFFDPSTGDVRMSPLYAGASSSPVDYVEMSKVSTGYGTVAANDYINFRGAFPLAGADT